jgi:hypothetical protein
MLSKQPSQIASGSLLRSSFSEEGKKIKLRHRRGHLGGVLVCPARKKPEMKILLVLMLLCPLVSGAQIESLSCSSTSITGAASDECTVRLMSPAGRNGLTVGLKSNNSAVTLPKDIWVEPRASSLSFAATVTAVPYAQTAILTAFYNYAGVKSPQTVSLNLYPLAGSILSVTPSSLSFGSVTLNTASTLSVTLRNTGNSPISGTAGVTGGGFSMPPPGQGVLPPGQSSTAIVKFDPSSVGAATGSLTIQTNAENSLVVVPLMGTGESTAQHSITLKWGAPTSSPEPITGYITYRSANGATYTALNSTSSTETAYVDRAVQPGITYSYYVKSVAQNGSTSIPSNMVEASIP